MAAINVKENLASSLGRRDEEPNIELAQRIVSAKDKAAVKDLVTLLHDKKKDVQNDSIKVLYEVGSLEPVLLKPHLDTFLEQLRSKNNRMVWGAMTAIDAITVIVPQEVYDALPEILDAGEKGSVIAKDHVVGILVKLAGVKNLHDNVTPLLFEQLVNGAHNQFAMYAENVMTVVSAGHREKFVNILEERLPELPKDSQKKRVEKILRKLFK